MKTKTVAILLLTIPITVLYSHSIFGFEVYNEVFFFFINVTLAGMGFSYIVTDF